MGQMPDYEKIAEGIAGIEKPVSKGVTKGKQTKARRPKPSEREYLPLDHEKYQGIAKAKGYKQDDYSGNRLQRVHYSHEAMIDVILAEPTLTQNDLAERFGRSRGWVSIVMGSDAFQAALAKRRDDLMNPEIVASLEERMRGLADQSLQILSEKLEKTQNTELAVKALEISSKALGFGARGPSVQTNNTFVVAIPPKIDNSAEWAATHMKTANPKQIEG